MPLIFGAFSFTVSRQKRVFPDRLSAKAAFVTSLIIVTGFRETVKRLKISPTADLKLQLPQFICVEIKVSDCQVLEWIRNSNIDYWRLREVVCVWKVFIGGRQSRSVQGPTSSAYNVLYGFLRVYYIFLYSCFCSTFKTLCAKQTILKKLPLWCLTNCLSQARGNTHSHVLMTPCSGPLSNHEGPTWCHF